MTEVSIHIMKNNTYAFVGFGLIAGSIARSIRENHPNAEIIAFNRSLPSLELASKEGVLNAYYQCLDETSLSKIGQCEFIFLCAPVEANNRNLEALAPFVSQGSILTDVGSVKNSIHAKIRELGLQNQFIGGHPMAGSEKTGFANSNSKILENAYYILAPEPGVNIERVNALRSLTLEAHAIPLIIKPELHDYITGAISHLPHVIAASLVNFVHQKDDDGFMKLIAAGGFKDITRIASSSPDMWKSICSSNKDNILQLLTDYITYLEQIKDTINCEEFDQIYSFFDSAKNYRDSFTNVGSGPIKKTFVFSVDVDDKAGAIAEIATVLAKENINIKNIGINHNREIQQGALAIEFYDEAAMLLAKHILKENSYCIY